MAIEVEVVSEIMRYVLGNGTNKYEDEIINDSVGMEDATKSDNGYGGVVNDMELGEYSTARWSSPNIRLRGSDIDYDKYSLEEMVEYMEMEA